MKHKRESLIGSLVGTAGHDTFFLHAGNGTLVVSGFNPAEDYVMLDSGGVYDGLVGAFQNGPYLEDGDTFTNSHGFVFSVDVTDWNSDGSLDTVIHMGTDQIVLLSADQVPYSDVFGG